MKRFAIIIGLVLVLIALGVGYYKLGSDGGEKRSVFDALPENTSLILSLSDATVILETIDSTNYGAVLAQTGLYKKIKQDVAGIDSTLLAGGYTLSDTRLLASVYSTDKDGYDLLYVLETSASGSSQIVDALAATETFKIKQRAFREHQILDVTAPNGNVYSLAAFQGVLIVSKVAFLVEEAMLQLIEKESIALQPGLAKLLEIGESTTDLSLYVKFGNLRALDNMVFGAKAIGFRSKLHRLADWAALDVAVRANNLFFTGYSSVSDTNLLAGQSFATNVDFEVDRSVPENTMAFTYTSFNLLNDPGAVDSLNFYSYWNNWVKGGVVHAWMESYDANYADDAFVVIPVSDIERVQNDLDEMSRLSGAEKGRIFDAGVFDLFFDDLLDIPSDPFYALHGDQLYLADNAAILERVLSKLDEGSSLFSNISYQQFKKQVSHSANFTIYVAPKLGGEVLNELIAPEVVNKAYRSFSPLVLQFTDHNGLFFTNAYIRAGDSRTPAIAASDNGAIWRIQLDTTIHNKPWFVINHDTNEEEVFVQDKTGNIYLIDKAGKLLWKRSISGLILGDVHQVDLYKNDKLQLIFNTQHEMYLIDRLGNDVEQFPIRLPADAASGMAVFDYDGKKNYRYFVGCENYKVYGYYPNGKPLPGWSPKPRVGTVVFPMQYATAGNKDFLIMQNIDGTLLFFDRRGDRRVRPVRLKSTFDQPFVIKQKGDDFELANASVEKVFFVVNSNGDELEFDLSEVPDYIGFTTLTLNDSIVYCFADSGTIFTLDHTFKLSHKQFLEEPIDGAPFAVNWGQAANTHLGLVNSFTGKIYLFNSDLEPVAGFPLDGATPFDVANDLFGDGQKVIITGDKDGYLNAFRLP